MTSEQQSVREWMKEFGQETPEKPCIPSLEVRKLRAKLILEEALETAKALGFDIDEGHLVEDMMGIATIVEPNLAEIADGCEDLKVVTEGTLVACGLCQKRTKSVMHGDHLGTYNTREMDWSDPLFNEVMRSNFSKLWNSEDLEEKYPKGLPEGWTAKIIAEHPEVEGIYSVLVKDKDGKVIKSPSYSPANLQPIIDEMSR